MKQYIKTFLVSILCSCCVAAAALSSASEALAAPVEISLDEALELARKNSKATEQLNIKSEIAEAKLGEIQAKWWPKISAIGGIMFWTDTQKMEVVDKENLNLEGRLQEGVARLDPAFQGIFAQIMPAFQPSLQELGNAIPSSIELRDSFTAALGLTLVMPLTPLFQVYQGQKLAELGIRDVEYEKKGRELQTDYEVTDVYLKLVYAQLMIDVAQEAYDTITRHVEMALKYENVGFISHADVLSAEVQQVKARQDVMEARQGARLAGMKLVQVLGLPRGSEIHASDMPNDAYAPQLQELTSYQETALQQRTELERLSLTQELGDRSAKIALMDYMPKIALIGSYTYLHGVDMFDSNQAFIGLAMKWTIFDGLEKYYTAKRARLEATQNASRISEAQDLIALEVSQKYLNLETALDKLSLTQQALVLADENLRTISAQFAQGESVNTDVLTAQTKRAAARADDVKARIDVLNALAALKLSLGEEPKLSEDALQ